MSEPRKEVLSDSVTLWLGDCRDVLPLIGRVDAVVTDPVWPNAPDGMFKVENPRLLLSEALSVLDAKRAAIILRTDSDPRFLGAVSTDWKFIRTQNLEYACPGHIGRVLGGLEILYGFGEPIPSREGQRVIPGNSPRVQPSEKFDHPCARNLEHMKFAIRWWSEFDEVVCDPFMGSGTTGVACVNLGRKFIGIEIEPKYYDIARRRITDALNQPRLALDEPVAPKQEALSL